MPHDQIAINLLRQWAKRPWDDVLRLALADRIEELGLSLSVDLRESDSEHDLHQVRRHITLAHDHRESRRRLCPLLRLWWNTLNDHLGFLDPVELPF